MGPSTLIKTFTDSSTRIITTSNTLASKCLPKRKRVRFASTASFVETLHAKNYTTEELKNTWYMRDEYAQISKEIKESLVHLESMPCQQGPTKNDDDCLRGLEARTDIGFLRRKRNKRNGMQAVLVEQENQYRDNFHDAKAIAMAYYFMTKQCVTLAREIAIADELEAAKIYSESK
jgi:hypothetical protein